MTCLTPGCSRARIPAEHGIVHAHCAACESRLLREAFGPVSWHDRAAPRSPVTTPRRAWRGEVLPPASASPALQVAETTTAGA